MTSHLFLKFLTRLLGLAITLIAVFTLSRALVRALPGDPIQTLIEETGTQVATDELRARLGLDKPFFTSVAYDLSRALHGDLGRSVLSGAPVAPELAKRFTATLKLAFSALILGLTVSLILGVSACAYPGSSLAAVCDKVCSVYGAFSAALPTAWTGPILLYFLAVAIPIFPLGGHIALPTLTISVSMAGVWSRLVRAQVRESLGRGGMFGPAASARARGVSEWVIALKYGLAPASGPLLAFLGTQGGALLGGAFISEIVFDWPGIGSYLVEAVLARDYPIVEAAIVVTASAALAGTALGDFAHDLVSPYRRSQ